MQVASNVLSRKSHYRHEGQPSEYWAAKDFYLNQLDAQGRARLHSNTGRLLKFADEIVKKNYVRLPLPSRPRAEADILAVSSSNSTPSRLTMLRASTRLSWRSHRPLRWTRLRKRARPPTSLARTRSSS